MRRFLSTRWVAGLGLVLALAGLDAATPPAATAVSSVFATGCDDHDLPSNDDDSSEALDLPFPVKIGSRVFEAAWVNNNGNVTFDEPMSDYTPFGLEATDRAVVAPFFADVDTRGAGSNNTTYSWGTTTFKGRRALCVNWVDVGYYSSQANLLNSFQLVITNRSDTGYGNVDLYFHYDKIEWETGDASEGGGGTGGVSAAVGFSNGEERYFQMPGSRRPGSFLDGAPRSLSVGSNVGVPGRWAWNMRGGAVPSTYVALGDSFQSGEGAYRYEDSGNACHRSQNAYPYRLVNSGLVPYALDFKACSGAKIADVDEGGNFQNERAQVDALADSTELVTLGIVGNDLNFGSIIKQCVIQGGASLALPLTSPVNACRDWRGSAVRESLTSLENGKLRGELDGLYTNVRSKARNAKVVVFTYPQFFNEPSTTRGQLARLLVPCQAIRGSDQSWINDSISRANAAISSLARSKGFRVVDLTGAFSLQNRGICSSNPAMNGIVWTSKGRVANESFHPNSDGHEIICDEARYAVSKLGSGTTAADCSRQYEGPVFRTRAGVATTNGLEEPSALGATPYFRPEVDLLEDLAVTPDQEITRTVSIARASELSVIGRWLDGDVGLTLTAPSGAVISLSSPGAAIPETRPGFTGFTIPRPEPGQWTIRVRGTRILDTTEAVELSAFAPGASPAELVATVRGTASRASVTLDATGSKDPSGAPVNLLWDFGDGTTGIGAKVKHTYRSVGTYRPSLVVSGTDGRAAFASAPVTVKVAAPLRPTRLTFSKRPKAKKPWRASWPAVSPGVAPKVTYQVEVWRGSRRLQRLITGHTSARIITRKPARYRISVRAINAYGSGPAIVKTVKVTRVKKTRRT